MGRKATSIGQLHFSYGFRPLVEGKRRARRSSSLGKYAAVALAVIKSSPSPIRPLMKSETGGLEL